MRPGRPRVRDSRTVRTADLGRAWEAMPITAGDAVAPPQAPTP